MSLDLPALRHHIAAHGPTIRVTVTATSGSAPREPGAALLVTQSTQSGTIGGGALEFDAIRTARTLLPKTTPWLRHTTQTPLGPTLGQCCGGAVSLLFERFTEAEAAQIPDTGLFIRPTTSGPPTPEPYPLAITRLTREARSGHPVAPLLTDGLFAEPLTPTNSNLWLYGAGHVGRALTHILQDLPFTITWIDDAPTRFPDQIPPNATRFVAQNPADAVQHAPDDATHLVLTYSHALDLEITHRVLSRPFHHLGLIGSATKRARFLSRLRALGHSDAALSRIQCPIGTKSLGKHPAAIALGVAAQLTEGHMRGTAQESKEAKA